MQGGLVTVFGGAGFIGRHIVRALAKRGWRIRAAVRRPDLAGHLQPMGAVGQIHAVQANIRFPESIGPAVVGADVVVNAVGILAQTGEQTFEHVQAEGAEDIAKAAKAAGVRRLVHLSSIGADSESSSAYARTKAKGEKGVLEAFPEAVIMRPSIVFGPEDGFFNRFGAMASRFPHLLPSIGGGTTRFQPVYVGDVAAAVVAAIEGEAKPGAIYELGGPEVLTFLELLKRTAEYTGRNAKPFPIPFIAAKVGAVMTAILPNALRPITFDQVKLLEHDNVVSEAAVGEGRTLQGLGIMHPVPVGAIVPGYLERFRPKGQFSHYRG